MHTNTNLGNKVCLCVCIYPEFLQAFACPAVVDSHSAIFTPRDDVLVICSQAHYSITMETEAFHQGFSSCGQNIITFRN